MDNFELGSSNPVQQEETINLRHYWHIILERRWLIITAFISVFVLSLIYLFKATPIYRATARLQINPETESFLRVEGIAVGRQEQDYLQTQYKNLLSRSLIQSVVTKLKLDQDPRYAKSPDPVRAVANDIQVAPIRLSRLVDINVEHPDAGQASLMANTVVSNFIEMNRVQKILATDEVVDLLKDAANDQSNRLERAEQNLLDYVAVHNKVSFEETENIVSQALKQLQTDFAQAKSAADAAVTEAAQVDGFLQRGISKFNIPQIANNADIQQLRTQLAVAEAEFAAVQVDYLSKHPKYQAAAEKVTSLKESIDRQADTIIAAIRVRADTSVAQRNSLEVLVREQETELIQLNQLRKRYALLKREAEANDQLYRQVLAKMQETELTGKDKINNLVVVDPADVPYRPVKPRALLTIFLGVVGGLGVALGLAFFVNYLDDSIKSQDDVETYLRLAFLGYIPNIKSNSVVERDLQSHLHPQSNAAEGFRTIRATVSLTHKPDKFRVLAITSTIPSEGKSLVASNLAIVTAQTGLRTLLIDADLRRPSVHKAYQLHAPRGLSSFLMDEANQLEEIIHKTEVPNLDVVCCGSVPSTPSELISSKRMMDFLHIVRERYDRVILDCPPISAVSDPLIISAMCDGIVFVTKFNKIRREHARKAVQRVQNAGIHIVGVVLNDIDFEGKDSYYYSYYYYQNRYYSSHYRPGAGERKKEKGASALSGPGDN